MEGIENQYPDNTAYQFLRPSSSNKNNNSIIPSSTRRGISPLKESSTNIINNSNSSINLMLRDSKSLVSPIKPMAANNSLNFKKRAATSPTPTLISQNTKRKVAKTSSIRADEENISPIKPRYDKSNQDYKSRVNEHTHDEKLQEPCDIAEYPLWPPQSSAEAQLHRQLYLMEQKSKHYEELSRFLALERQFQIEVQER